MCKQTYTVCKSWAWARFLPFTNHSSPRTRFISSCRSYYGISTKSQEFLFIRSLLGISVFGQMRYFSATAATLLNHPYFPKEHTLPEVLPSNEPTRCFGKFCWECGCSLHTSGTWTTSVPMAPAGPSQPRASTEALPQTSLPPQCGCTGWRATQLPPFPPCCVQQSSQESEKLPNGNNSKSKHSFEGNAVKSIQKAL